MPIEVDPQEVNLKELAWEVFVTIFPALLTLVFGLVLGIAFTIIVQSIF